MSDYADKPLRLDKVEWHTGVPPYPTPPLFTEEEKEALARAADAFMEKQKEDNVIFDEIIKSTDLPEGVDYIQLTSQITDNEIFTIADYVSEDDDGFPIPLGEVPGDKLIPMVIIGLDSLYDSMPDGEHKLKIARVSLELANLRYKEELRKMKDNEEEK